MSVYDDLLISLRKWEAAQKKAETDRAHFYAGYPPSEDIQADPEDNLYFRTYTDKNGNFTVDINMDIFRVDRDTRKIVTQPWYIKHERFLKIFDVQEAVIL